MHKRFTKRCISFLSAAIAAALMLGACAQAPGGEPLAPDEKGGVTDAPIHGGSISIAMPANPETLNPLEAQTREMIDLFGLIYDPLVRFDAQLRPVPGLAERWTSEEGGKRWTFTLQKGATFHNGAPLAAADVVYTLDLLKSIYGDAKRKSLYSGVIALLSSYTAQDDNTIVLVLKEPSAQILHWLHFPILQNNSLQSDRIAPGTGPYRVGTYEAGKQLVLTANTQWWRRTPYIETIVAKAMPDPETALTSMDVKLVDVVHTTSLTAHSYKRQDVTNAYELMTQELECIIPNMNNAQLVDVRMRTAIIAALDRKTIITEAYLNHAVSIDVPIPPDVYLYETTHLQHAYSIGRAKDLIEQMGYVDTDGDGIVDKDGAPLHFDVIVNESTLTSARVDAARMAKEQLRLVGIDCTVSVMSFSKFETQLKNGNFDLAFAAFSIPADGDLRFLLQSGAQRNYGRYQNGALDALLNAYVGAVSEGEQVAASAAVQKHIAEELPIISLYFRTNTLVSSASVRGITGARDMDVYRAVEHWYKHKVGDEATPTP